MLISKLQKKQTYLNILAALILNVFLQFSVMTCRTKNFLTQTSLHFRNDLILVLWVWENRLSLLLQVLVSRWEHKYRFLPAIMGSEPFYS